MVFAKLNYPVSPAILTSELGEGIIPFAGSVIPFKLYKAQKTAHLIVEIEAEQYCIPVLSIVRDIITAKRESEGVE